jgi:hypothetical protein
MLARVRFKIETNALVSDFAAVLVNIDTACHGHRKNGRGQRAAPYLPQYVSLKMNGSTSWINGSPARS